MALHLPRPAMSPPKPTRQHERPLHKLTRMSVHRALVIKLNALILRTVRERVGINDIRLYLRLEVIGRGAITLTSS